MAIFSQTNEGKAPLDANCIGRRFILFIPPGKRGSNIQVLSIIFLSKHRMLTMFDAVNGNAKQAAMEKRFKQSEESSALFTHQLVTLADLEKFKEQILSEMRRLLSGGSTQLSKQWLKSREVRKLLDVSPGKLHAMRASRQLTFMRIGGVIYYDRKDIDKMFEEFKTAAVK
jgi:hypothetical protein